MNMQLKADNVKTEYISILRMFAIFSVVCAHVTDSTSSLSNLVISSLGTFGVGVFYIISGYFFYRDKKNPAVFARKKLTSVILPWMFCGTLDWLYVVIRRGGFSLQNWVSSNFVHSHYYYLSVLLVFYLVMWKLRKNHIVCVILLSVSFTSMWLTGKGLLSIYPYINPLNWLAYFIVGIEISRHDCFDTISLASKKLLPYTFPLSIFLFCWVVYDGKAVSYWYHGTVVSIALMIMTIMGLTKYICDYTDNQSKVKSLLIWGGNFSFSIYLIHMPFAGVIKYFIDKFDYGIGQFLAPFLVIATVCVCLYLILKIPFPHKVKQYINMILGIRA